ncbi:DMT family transporter [Derxia gummosa]|uniref:DMT family transporter n=1 Tax=Derxia gummosa DSM 723 TaxID=1121388 RepID=A0A8B6X6B3_9BURK|nr:DMT family transporter [Derxia gummosa]
MTQALTFRTAVFLTIPPLLWAGNSVVGRMAVGLVPPLGLNFMRWALVFLMLLPLGHAALRDPAALWARKRYLALLGLTGVGSYNALQYMALHTSSALNATLITASAPVWMLLIGALVYRVMPRPRELAGAALSLAGVALVIARGDFARLAQLHFVTGDLLMVAAIISWGFYSWLLARPPANMQGTARPDWNWAAFLLAQTGFGLIWCAASAGAEAALGLAHWEWSWRVLALVVFVAVGPGLTAFRFWGLGVSLVGPSVASFFVNLTPVFAAVLSAGLLGEPPAWFHAVAFALIASGIVVSSRR